jgi:hypothetical protein
MSILRPFGTFSGHIVHFLAFWYIFPHFGMLYQEKSGNPDSNTYQVDDGSRKLSLF